MGQIEEAIIALKRAEKYNPKVKYPSALLSVAYGQLGRTEEARAAIEWRLKLLAKQGFVGNFLRQIMFYWPSKDIEVERFFAEGFLKAGVPGSYYKSSIFQEHNLVGDEIRDLVFGRTVTGFDFKTEEEYSIKYAKDGKTLYRRGDVSDTGKAWIEDDRLCNQWQHLYGGYEDCTPVFKNPEGTKEKKDEYIGIAAYGFVPFSVVD